MAYKLNANANGDVKVIMKAGSDYVKTTLPKGKVIGIIELSKKIEKSDKFDGFEICLDGGKTFVAGTLEEEKPEPQQEVVSEKPKQEFFKKHNNNKKKN